MSQKRKTSSTTHPLEGSLLVFGGVSIWVQTGKQIAVSEGNERMIPMDYICQMNVRIYKNPEPKRTKNISSEAEHTKK